MAFTAADIPELDWELLRQFCAAALGARRPVQIIGGGSYLSTNPACLPLFDDMVTLSQEAGLGTFDVKGGDIFFEPRDVESYNVKINGGKFSSFVEMVLFLVPWCFTRDFRTVITCEGVSHSPLSPPPSFLRESLFNFLETMGLYAGIQLQRFGFYGSGGGSAVARIYPAEARPVKTLLPEVKPRIIGARIFFARISPELAKRQKQRVTELLKLDDRDVAIIDIREADGMGNSIQVSIAAGERMLQVSGDMPIYNYAGDLVVDEDDFNRIIEKVCSEALKTVKDGSLTDELARELFPFVVLSGNEDLPGNILLPSGQRDEKALKVFKSLQHH